MAKTLPTLIPTCSEKQAPVSNTGLMRLHEPPKRKLCPAENLKSDKSRMMSLERRGSAPDTRDMVVSKSSQRSFTVKNVKMKMCDVHLFKDTGSQNSEPMSKI